MPMMFAPPPVYDAVCVGPPRKDDVDCATANVADKLQTPAMRAWARRRRAMGGATESSAERILKSSCAGLRFVRARAARMRSRAGNLRDAVRVSQASNRRKSRVRGERSGVCGESEGAESRIPLYNRGATTLAFIRL